MKNNKTNKNSSSSSSSSSSYYSYSLSFSFSSTSSCSLSPNFTLLGRSHIFLSYHHPLQHMQHIRFPVMKVKEAYDVEHMRSTQSIQHELWPLDEIDPKKAKFPCCLVWTPLPIVSWLAPFIGHVGICREDGAILDFAGSNFVNADDFAFGAVARYLQLDRTQCCFAANLGGHTCKSGYKHAEFGTAITWDDALQSSSRYFEHKTYNLFTCNCHSFVANCLNRIFYGGSMSWNMINVAGLVLLKGQWVDAMSVLRSFLPFLLVLSLGVFMVGWPFLVALLSFSLLLVVWFLLGNYCFKTLLEC